MIRRAIATDAEALLTLERGVTEAAHWNAAEYAQILQAGQETSPLQRWIFVAEENSVLLGFLVMKVLLLGGVAEAEIENLAVVTEARRRGLGAALCVAGLEAAIAAGAQAIELEMRAGNTAALGLYERLGFVQTGRRAGYYANPPEDAVLLRYKQKSTL